MNNNEQEIIHCLRANYGIEVSKMTRILLGADMNATVYQANDQEKNYFIKIKRGHQHDISTMILEMLHKAGIEHIVLPIKNFNGKLIQIMGDSSLIVYPFINGQDGFSRDLTKDQWVILGKALRKIHDLQIPSSIQAMIRHEKYSPQWRQAARSILNHLDMHAFDNAIAIKLHQFMKQHQNQIQQLVDGAEELCQKIINQPQNYVLCHSDIHGGNVLMDDNDLIYLVDWDDPIMAPKERDLMFIGGGVANVWNKSHEEEYFYQGYGKVDIDKTILSYYRHERIVEDIAIYAEQIFMDTDTDTNLAQRYQHFIAQFEPRGVVDITLHGHGSIPHEKSPGLRRIVDSKKTINILSSIDTLDKFHEFKLDMEMLENVAKQIIQRHHLPDEPLTIFSEGSNIVFSYGDAKVLKIFPPMHRDQFESELLVLNHLQGKLQVSIPSIGFHGELLEWPYIMMEKLEGTLLEELWENMDQNNKIIIIQELGALIREIHSLSTEGLKEIDCNWNLFIQQQIDNCTKQHLSKGLQKSLLDQIPSYINPIKESLSLNIMPVLLTGEYTPMNFLVKMIDGLWRISGLIDFGDCMLGLPEYDLLGPGAFLIQGDKALLKNFLMSYGYSEDMLTYTLSHRLTALMLLHKYSNLNVQIRIKDWQSKVQNLIDLEKLVWGF